MKCYNLSRKEAKYNTVEVNPSENAWISVMEPDGKDFVRSHIENEFLDKCPTLKIKFWDVSYKVPFIGSSFEENEATEYAEPITDEQITELYTFIMTHKDKNIYVNCAAGKCRSGAICQFCQDMLQFEWPDQFKNRAVPNSYVYKKLIELFFRNGGTPPTIIHDRRRIK